MYPKMKCTAEPTTRVNLCHIFSAKPVVPESSWRIRIRLSVGEEVRDSWRLTVKRRARLRLHHYMRVRGLEVDAVPVQGYEAFPSSTSTQIDLETRLPFLYLRYPQVGHRPHETQSSRACSCPSSHPASSTSQRQTRRASKPPVSSSFASRRSGLFWRWLGCERRG